MDLFPAADFEAVGLSFSNGSAIDKQLNLRAVGIRFDFGDGFCSGGGSAGGDIHHRLGIPVGLVKVKGVFFDFGVVGPTLKLPF